MATAGYHGLWCEIVDDSGPKSVEVVVDGEVTFLPKDRIRMPRWWKRGQRVLVEVEGWLARERGFV